MRTNENVDWITPIVVHKYHHSQTNAISSSYQVFLGHSSLENHFFFSFLADEHSRKSFLSKKISSQRCLGLRSLEQFNPRVPVQRKISSLDILCIRDMDQFFNTFHCDLLQRKFNQLMKPKVLCIHFAVKLLHRVCTNVQDTHVHVC